MSIYNLPVGHESLEIPVEMLEREENIFPKQSLEIYCN